MKKTTIGYPKRMRAWAAVILLGLTSLGLHAQDLEQGRAPTEEDAKILLRAAEILEDHSRWNQFDDRQCEDDDKDDKWSLFCALSKASIEISGTYEHRRPALQQVRLVIAEVTGRHFKHPIKDFNNSADTGLDDIKKVLAIAYERVHSQLKPSYER